MESEVRLIEDLPFLKSLCWQGQTASIKGLSEDEILQMYERNWRYRGMIAELGKDEEKMLVKLATQHRSWLANELQAHELNE
ncbi:MAG: hypothetical protein AAF810_12785 [Cyanobacteria bacterium P01_D01_bin.36]